MLAIEIPGGKSLKIEFLLLDYNGTIAVDGILLPGIRERLLQLAPLVTIYVLTADTFGTAAQQCRDLPVTLKSFPREDAAGSKEQVAAGLQGDVVAIGNGYNDIPMFDQVALSILILEQEGCCAKAVGHGDVLVRSACDAFDLLLQPNRLRATLHG